MAKDTKKSENIDADQLEKELEKRKAEAAKKRKALEKKEEKRIRRLVKFPFKTLFQLSLLAGAITFLIQHYGSEVDMIRSLYRGSLAVLAFLLGGGLIMAVLVWIISDIKKKELEQEIEAERERLRLEEEERAKHLRALEEEIKVSERELKNATERSSEPTALPPSSAEQAIPPLEESTADVAFADDFQDNANFADDNFANENDDLFTQNQPLNFGDMGEIEEEIR